MNLIDKIKQTQLGYRKAGDKTKASILSTLIGEAEAIGKNDGNRQVTDAEVIKLAKKFVDNNTANIVIYRAQPGAELKVEVLEVENQVYAQFIPSQLSEEKLREVITEIVSGLPEKNAKAMGEVVKQLKAQFEGQYDAKLASTIAKELL